MGLVQSTFGAVHVSDAGHVASPFTVPIITSNPAATWLGMNHLAW
ncbi:MAG: hypothetical protein P4L33_14150 [Capsulimonadaceae bacterium]|nr:hypothetical protein [Capsulimonadaceae bacterium]